MGSNFEMEPIIPMRWTFDEGIRASCDAFSIAIPDGYRIQECQDDDSEDIDVTFSAVPKANEDNETSFRIAIRIAENLPKDAFEEHGIDELVIAMFRKALNDDENVFIPNSPEHWVAQGKNCPVLVTRIYSQLFGLFTRNSYLIRPISNDMSFRVEITMDEMNDDIAEEMHEPINALVSSIETTKPLKSNLTKMLDKISTQKVTPQEFSETVNHLVKVVSLCKDTENTANQLEYLRNCDELNGYDATRAVVMGMEDFLGRIFPMFVRAFDAIEFQRSFGCTEDELTSYFEVAKAMLEPCITICDAIDQQSAQFLSEHGPIALPDGFWKIVDSIDVQLPGTRSEMEMRIKAANEQFQAAIEEHINKAPDDNEESDGVDYPTLMMTLLSDDWFFFMDDEITWDGHHHAIAGAQLNGAKADELLDFVNSCIPGFDDVNEVFRYFVTLLNEIEKDEGLIVPRAIIAPGVQKAIREGDLTGLTLANLAACSKALCVQKVERGAYRVIFDGRLIKGIPRFLDLLARLLWDLRQCTNSMRDKPFEISFLQARNIDADQYLGSVETPVPGAQEYTMCMKVTEAPSIQLPGANDAKAYHEQGSVELSPEDDMALTCISALVRDFPLVNPISGTHHMDRAERIERVNVGDKLILAANWNCEFFDPAGIEVFNEQGETLGYLEGVIGPNRGALALLLPHITASAASVTPLSARRKGAKYALMNVRLELDDDATVEGTSSVDPSNELLAEARRLLCLPKPERTVMSHASIDISRLKGHVDVTTFPRTESASSPIPQRNVDPSAATLEEHERRKEERRAEEERAEAVARIEQIKYAIEGYDEELQSHDVKIKDAGDAAYRVVVRGLDRPIRREALYKRYTAELMRDLELTNFNRFLQAQRQSDLESDDIAPLLHGRNIAVDGPLLKDAESFIDNYSKYCEKIEKGRKGDKSTMFENPYHGRILEHLVEVGGDLSPEEVSSDLFETKGVYWNPPEGSEDDPIDVQALLRYMQFPALEMSKALVDLDGKQLLTPNTALWDSYAKSQSIFCFKRKETGEDRCRLWFSLPLDKVSQLHYRRMLMDESHGAQTQIERLEGEIKRKEKLLEHPEELAPLQAQNLNDEIFDFRKTIGRYEELTRKADERERSYLEYRALFYARDQAEVIPRDSEVEKTALFATRPVEKPTKQKSPQAKNASSSAQPASKPSVNTASSAPAETPGGNSGCLIPSVAAAIGFFAGCLNGSPFMGILLAGCCAVSATLTINALKK